MWFVARRLAVAALVLVASSAIVFLLGRLAPGDPVQLLMGDLRDPVAEARLRRDLALDRPLPEQYLRFAGRALRGDLGQSYANPGRPVAQMIGQALHVTLQLAVVTVVLAILLGVPLGILSGAGRGSVTDAAARLLALAGVSVPSFVVALLLILVMALGLRLVPVSGWGEPRHFVLPVLALLVQPLAYITRMTRTGVVQVLAQEYVRTAHAKGCSSRRVLLVHVVPNAGLAVITVIALALSYALTGALVVETIFRVPGMGQAAVGAFFQRDYPMVQAVGLVYTAVFITTSLLADLGYALLDPRIRY
jgi:peptide/nickel transport system permease protein